MSDELDALRNSLTTWYMGLDDRTRGFFEAAYARAPEAVTDALGGQAVVASKEVSQYTTLAAMLGADTGGDVTTVVPYMWGEPPTVDPAAAQMPFTVHWTVRNYGTASAGHVEELIVIDQANEVAFSTTREVKALEKGAEAALEAAVPGLREGSYVARIHHNKEGKFIEEVAYASRKVGICSMSDTRFEIGKGTFDYELLRTGNERMQPLLSGAQNSHHILLADAIETYARAFGNEPGEYANDLSAIFQATTAARAASVSKDAVFAGTSGTAKAVTASADALLAGTATTRQLLDSLNAVTRDLRNVAAGGTQEMFEDVNDNFEASTAPPSTTAAPATPVAKAVAPTQPTLSSDAFASSSYEDTAQGAADTGPEPYVNLSSEVSEGGEESEET